MHKWKRWICMLLTCSLFLGGLLWHAPEASAYMASKPLPKLTGNTAEDVANIAISQLGYHEVDGGTVYGAWWSGVTGWGNYTYLGWCAMFANWCAYQAGAGMDIAYNKYCAIVGNSFDYLRSNAYVDRSFKTTPQPGDFIYFGRGNSFEHVAVVVGYNSATNQVTFVGGNQSNAVTQGSTTWSSTGRWGSQYVLGYGRPNYGGDSSCGCSADYAGNYTVVTVSNPLNIRSGHSTASAIVGRIPRGATVYVSKAQGNGADAWAHVEYNGVHGYVSMQYLNKEAAPEEPEIAIELVTGLSNAGKPVIKWNEISGAARYEVYRAEAADGAFTKVYTTEGLSYTNTAAVEGNTYYYKLRVVLNNGKEATSEVVSVFCPDPNVGLVVTTGFNEDGKPVIKWEPISGAQYYEVYRSDRADGEFVLTFTTQNSSYTNTGAKAGNTYYYKVKVVLADGTEKTSEVVAKRCLRVVG